MPTTTITAERVAEAEPQRPGYFGEYGGQFVPEVLMPALRELEQAYTDAKHNEAFQAELALQLRDFVGRQTPLYEAKRRPGLPGRVANANARFEVEARQAMRDWLML